MDLIAEFFSQVCLAFPQMTKDDEAKLQEMDESRYETLEWMMKMNENKQDEEKMKNKKLDKKSKAMEKARIRVEFEIEQKKQKACVEICPKKKYSYS